MEWNFQKKLKRELIYLEVKDLMIYQYVWLKHIYLCLIMLMSKVPQKVLPIGKGDIKEIELSFVLIYGANRVVYSKLGSWRVEA